MMMEFVLGLCDLMEIDVDNSYDVVVVSRKHARHIVNIDEVIQYLEKYFFDLSILENSSNKWKINVVNLGELSACEQIATVRKARVFITIHGAGYFYYHCILSLSCT